MPTVTKRNRILQEVDRVPFNRLEELYQFIHSLTPTVKNDKLVIQKKKILSFAGAFNDMSNEDYSSFVDELKKTRMNLFNRDIKL